MFAMKPGIATALHLNLYKVEQSSWRITEIIIIKKNSILYIKINCT